MTHQPKYPAAVTRHVLTGQHAPASGWWSPETEPEPFRYLQRGEIMPALDGDQTMWKLVLELEPLQRIRSSTYGPRPAKSLSV